MLVRSIGLFVLSGAVALAGCSSSDSGGGTGGTGATGGSAGSGTGGSGGSTGGTGGTAGSGGSTGGTGGTAGSGGSMGGTGGSGGASAAAKAFCADYQTTCTFGSTGHYRVDGRLPHQVRLVFGGPAELRRDAPRVREERPAVGSVGPLHARRRRRALQLVELPLRGSAIHRATLLRHAPRVPEEGLPFCLDGTAGQREGQGPRRLLLEAAAMRSSRHATRPVIARAEPAPDASALLDPDKRLLVQRDQTAGGGP